jgi:transcriptional regulator of acetoin/glycerol metabolism
MPIIVRKAQHPQGGSIPLSVMTRLQTHHWPGNVRELEEVLKGAVIHSTGPCLELSAKFKEIRRERSYLASRIGNEGEIPSPMVSVSSIPART